MVSTEDTPLPSPPEPATSGIDLADLIAGLGRGLAVIESFDDAHARMTVAQVS